MSELTHLPCPRVECSSTDAFAYNDEKMTGYCHSCSTAYPKRDEEYYDWASEEYPVRRNTKMIEPTSVSYKDIRSIDEDVCKLYGIQKQLDASGKPLRYAYKYPHNTKYRDYNDKTNTWMKERGKGMLEMFGPNFNAGSSKRIYITEGEFDAASLYQVLGKTFPVKSLPSAAIGEKFFQHNYAELSKYEEIVYAGEQSDNAGATAADKFYQVFPEKLFYVPLTRWKDANEALQAGAKDAEALKWAAVKPLRYTPDNFFTNPDEFDRILDEENPYEYTPTGHSGLDGRVRGWVKGGLTFVKAPPGSGKTSIFRYAQWNLLKDTDKKFAPLHMEEQKSTTLRGVATYSIGRNVMTKEDAAENGVTEADVKKAVNEATQGGRCILFEMRRGDDPMKLVDYCKLAASVYGAEYVFIDHVQRLSYLGGVDNATNVLTKLAANLAQLAKELNIGIIFISHVNEDGKTKYASSLEEEAIVVIRIKRDQESADPELRNTTEIYVEKNRPYASLGEAGHLTYNPSTTIMEEAFL